LIVLYRVRARERERVQARERKTAEKIGSGVDALSEKPGRIVSPSRVSVEGMTLARHWAVRPGDIIAFAGSDFTSAVIQLGTFSLPGHGFSHVGIVGVLHGEPIIYESTTYGRPPCLRQGKPVSGVQAHRLDDLMEATPGSKVWHYPLRRELYHHESDRLCWFLDRCIGLPYDLRGAIRSGGASFNLLQTVLRKENLASVFCSELVAAALVDIGVFQTKSASRWNPNKLVRALRRQGTIAEGRRLQ
jgi:hypothetical protein